METILAKIAYRVLPIVGFPWDYAGSTVKLWNYLLLESVVPHSS